MKLTSEAENIIVKVAAFTLPLFFLPWTAVRAGIDNFNKLNLLYLAAGLLALLALRRFLRNVRIKTAFSAQDGLVLLFLAVYLLAAIFSIDRFASFFGGNAIITLPWFALLAGALIYFAVKTLGDGQKLAGWLFWLAAGFCAIVVGALFLTAGLWLGLFGSQTTAGTYFSLMVGGLDDLSVYIAVMSSLLFALILYPAALQTVFRAVWQRRTVKLMLVLAWTMLALIDFLPAWWILLAGHSAALAIRYYPDWKRGDQPRLRLRPNWALAALVLPLLFLFNAYALGGHRDLSDRLAASFTLDYASSVRLAGQAVRVHPFLGFGPDSFPEAYSRLRSPEMNLGDFWALRFSRSASFATDLAIGGGIFALLCFFALAVYFLRCIINICRRPPEIWKESAQASGLFAAVSAGFIASLAAQFLTVASVTQLFLFWFLLGCLALSSRSLPATGPSAPSELSSWRSAPVVISFLLWFVFMSFTAKYWTAQAYYRVGTAGDDGGTRAETALLNAVSLNSHRPGYRVALAKYYLAAALRGLNSNSDPESVRNQVRLSVDTAKEAASAFPASVAAAETLGMVYLALEPYAEGSAAAAAAAFDRAIALEPTNPVLHTEKGKALSAARNYADAAVSFKQARELKPDYYEAAFHLAKTYAEEGNTDEALALYEELEPVYDKTAVYYEQGAIYFNQRQYSQAITKFSAALALDPAHANALYGLALANEATGESAAALSVWRKLLILHPDNEEVKQRINDLGN